MKQSAEADLSHGIRMQRDGSGLSWFRVGSIFHVFAASGDPRHGIPTLLVSKLGFHSDNMRYFCPTWGINWLIDGLIIIIIYFD